MWDTTRQPAQLAEDEAGPHTLLNAPGPSQRSLSVGKGRPGSAGPQQPQKTTGQLVPAGEPGVRIFMLNLSAVAFCYHGSA